MVHGSEVFCPAVLAAKELGLGLRALGGLAAIIVDLIVIGAAQAQPLGIAHHPVAVLVVLNVGRSLVAELANDPELVLVRNLSLLFYMAFLGVLAADLLLLVLGDQACLLQRFFQLIHEALSKRSILG